MTADPTDAEALARRLAALPDRQMRCARLGEWLEQMPPQAAAWIIDTFATVGRAGGPPFDIGLLAVIDVASNERLSYECRSAIFSAAEALSLAACKEMFLSDAPQGDLGNAEAGAPRPLSGSSRPLSLGERKALARSWRRDVLERLVTDPHIDVVRLLLANPRVAERDILRIATSRRSSSDVLLLLLRSPRWGTSPSVRRALIRNPNTPISIALRLVGLLNRAELHELARDPSLPVPLRNALNRRLRPLS
jgi:hypothetical protein